MSSCLLYEDTLCFGKMQYVQLMQQLSEEAITIIFTFQWEIMFGRGLKKFTFVFTIWI